MRDILAMQMMIKFKSVAFVTMTTLLVILNGCSSAAPTATVPPTGTPRPTDTLAPPPVEATSEGTAIIDATATPLSPPTPTTGEAANADVLYVRAVLATNGTWTFHVTVQHPDTGWEDYADGWDVVTPKGEVLKPDPDSSFTRLLLHPHENEQPFTRSQSGVEIPDGVTQVRVRAHDLLDGYGGREVVVDLTASSGPDFEIQR